MRKDHLASRVSFSPSSLPKHRSMHLARAPTASPYTNSMLHAQNNSMDAVFSRITGQPGAMMAYEPSSELDEQTPTSPGIFEKWRSALVDSLDHEEAAAMDMYAANAADSAGRSFATGDASLTGTYVPQDAGFADGSMPMHQSPESMGPLLPLSRQSSRPVSPSRAGQWVKVGSALDPQHASAAPPARTEAGTGVTTSGSVGLDNGEFADARQRVMRKSVSQSSLSSLMAQAGGLRFNTQNTKEVAVPQSAPHSALSRPGSAGSMTKSRLSKMSTPELQALGLTAQPEKPVDFQQMPQARQQPPQVNVANSQQEKTESIDQPGARHRNGAEAAPAQDDQKREDVQQARSMAASLEEMLSKVLPEVQADSVPRVLDARSLGSQHMSEGTCPSANVLLELDASMCQIQRLFSSA